MGHHTSRERDAKHAILLLALRTSPRAQLFWWRPPEFNSGWSPFCGCSNKTSDMIGMNMPGYSNHSAAFRIAALLAITFGLIVIFDTSITGARQARSLPAKIVVEIGVGEKVNFVLIDPSAQPGRGQFQLGKEIDFTLPFPYYLGCTEVSRGQFARFVSAEGYKSESKLRTLRLPGMPSRDSLGGRSRPVGNLPGLTNPTTIR